MPYNTFNWYLTNTMQFILQLYRMRIVILYNIPSWLHKPSEQAMSEPSLELGMLHVSQPSRPDEYPQSLRLLTPNSWQSPWLPGNPFSPWLPTHWPRFTSLSAQLPGWLLSPGTSLLMAVFVAGSMVPPLPWQGREERVLLDTRVTLWLSSQFSQERLITADFFTGALESHYGRLCMIIISICVTQCIYTLSPVPLAIQDVSNRMGNAYGTIFFVCL